jgi:plasmid stability protein
MTEVRIRKLDEWVTTFLKSQAKAHNRSLEKELRELLTEMVRARKKQIAEDLLSSLNVIERSHGLFQCGTAGIREERDKRG